MKTNKQIVDQDIDELAKSLRSLQLTIGDLRRKYADAEKKIERTLESLGYSLHQG